MSEVTTQPLARITPAQISQRAREIRFRQALLRSVVAVFFLIGWVAAKITGITWYIIVWCAVAVSEGWRAGRPEREPARPG